MPRAEYLRETEVIEKDGYVSMAALTGPHEPEKVDDETGTIKQLVLDDLVTPNGKDQGMESNVMSHTEQSSERDGGMHV